ncbi:replicative DNA helicase [Riemerella columbipharyngis]|uniref:DNA 5'-3' helicase n=1 Tax=Riemerella columbipharyngis TaxID=1071918 RepID=A0A1G6ZDD0_9FLAO|nr:replicative DNA helicase [Riemerella columbipharyngis]SDE00634.1 replicative DNA helicase [Riemerella columbipharyngis]
MNNILVNKELEDSVLSSIIQNPTIYFKYYHRLSEEIFENLDNKLIFLSIKELVDENKNFDTLILLKKMEGKNLENRVIELLSKYNSSYSIEEHIMILVELAIKRDFIKKFTSLIEIAKSSEYDIFSIRDIAMSNFDELFIDKFIERNSPQNNFPRLIDQIQNKFENITSQITGVMSSIDIINKAIGGWQKSNLSIVAGRPGMGKTAFMVQEIIDAVAQDIPVGVFSLEMSAEQIATRIVTNATEIPNSSLLRKGLSDAEKERFYDFKPYLQSLNIQIDDSSSITIQNLRLKAKMMKLQYGIGILFVDYLQLISYESAKNREQEISKISRSLKALAKELDIPVIALSQLSRQVEQRPDKRPKLSDLRDSGSIEQDADEVIFLYRPEYYGIEQWDEYYNCSATAGEIEILIQKNRQGGLLSNRYKVNMATSKFNDIY